MAFDVFDVGKTGSITVSDLREVMGESRADDHVWAEIIRQADTSQNGEIEFDEFVALMSDV
jgi:Ca2+-binding EF-hand superfamily protein